MLLRRDTFKYLNMKKLKVQIGKMTSCKVTKKELGITEYLHQGDIEIKSINGVKVVFHKK